VIEFPSWLDWLGAAVGMEWPQGNEDQMWAMAGDWRTAASGLRTIVGDVEAARTATLDAYKDGKGSDSMAGAFDAVINKNADKSSLPDLADFFDQVGDSVDGTGTQIQYTKLMFYTTLTVTAAEIASVWIFPPSAPAEEAGIIVETRVAVRVMLRRAMAAIEDRLAKLIGARMAKFLLRHVIIGGLMGLLQDTGIQGFQDFEGHRHGINWGQALVSGISGAAGGAAGGPVAEALEHRLEDAMGAKLAKILAGTLSGAVNSAGAFAASVPTQFLVDGFTKGWGTAVDDLEHTQVDWRMFTAGAAGGFVSGLNHSIADKYYGTRKFWAGEGAPAGLPSIGSMPTLDRVPDGSSPLPVTDPGAHGLQIDGAEPSADDRAALANSSDGTDHVQAGPSASPTPAADDDGNNRGTQDHSAPVTGSSNDPGSDVPGGPRTPPIPASAGTSGGDSVLPGTGTGIDTGVSEVPAASAGPDEAVGGPVSQSDGPPASGIDARISGSTETQSSPVAETKSGTAAESLSSSRSAPSTSAETGPPVSRSSTTGEREASGPQPAIKSGAAAADGRTQPGEPPRARAGADGGRSNLDPQVRASRSAEVTPIERSAEARDDARDSAQTRSVEPQVDTVPGDDSRRPADVAEGDEPGRRQEVPERESGADERRTGDGQSPEAQARRAEPDTRPGQGKRRSELPGPEGDGAALPRHGAAHDQSDQPAVDSAEHGGPEENPDRGRCGELVLRLIRRLTGNDNILDLARRVGADGISGDEVQLATGGRLIELGGLEAIPSRLRRLRDGASVLVVYHFGTTDEFGVGAHAVLYVKEGDRVVVHDPSENDVRDFPPENLGDLKGVYGIVLDHKGRPIHDLGLTPDQRRAALGQADVDRRFRRIAAQLTAQDEQREPVPADRRNPLGTVDIGQPVEGHEPDGQHTPEWSARGPETTHTLSDSGRAAMEPARQRLADAHDERDRVDGQIRDMATQLGLEHGDRPIHQVQEQIKQELTRRIADADAIANRQSPGQGEALRRYMEETRPAAQRASDEAKAQFSGAEALGRELHYAIDAIKQAHSAAAAVVARDLIESQGGEIRWEGPDGGEVAGRVVGSPGDPVRMIVAGDNPQRVVPPDQHEQLRNSGIEIEYTMIRVDPDGTVRLVHLDRRLEPPAVTESTGEQPKPPGTPLASAAEPPKPPVEESKPPAEPPRPPAEPPKPPGEPPTPPGEPPKPPAKWEGQQGDPAPTRRDHWTRHGADQEHVPATRRLKRALRDLAQASSRRAKAWDGALRGAGELGIDPSDELRRRAHGFGIDEPSPHQIEASIRDRAETAIRDAYANHRRLSTEVRDPATELSRLRELAGQHGLELHADQETPGTLRARIDAAALAERDRTIEANQALAEQLDGFRVANANESLRRSEAQALAEREVMDAKAGLPPKGPRVYFDGALFKVRMDLGQPRVRELDDADGRRLIGVGDSPDPNIQIRPDRRRLLAERGYDAAYYRVTVGDGGTVRVTELHPDDVPPPRAAQSPTRRPGDWMPGDETAHPRTTLAHRRFRIQLRKMSRQIHDMTREVDKNYGSIVAAVRWMGIDPTGMSRQEIAHEVRNTILDHHAQAEEFFDRTEIAPDKMADFFNERRDIEERASAVESQGNAILQRLRIHELAVTMRDHMLAQQAERASRDVLGRMDDGTLVGRDGLPVDPARPQDAVARMVAAGDGKPARLEIISPTANPDHVLPPEVREQLLAGGGEIHVRQVRVDNKGRTWLSDLAEPSEGEIAAAHPAEPAARPYQPVTGPKGPDTEALEGPQAELDGLLRRRAGAAAAQEFWRNTLDHSIRRVNGASAGDMSRDNWAATVERLTQGRIGYTQDSSGLDNLSTSTREQLGEDELSSRQDPIDKLAEAAERFYGLQDRLDEIDQRIHELEQLGAKHDVSKTEALQGRLGKLAADLKAAIERAKPLRRELEPWQARYENDPASFTPDEHQALTKAIEDFAEANNQIDRLNDRRVGLGDAWRKAAESVANPGQLRKVTDNVFVDYGRAPDENGLRGRDPRIVVAAGRSEYGTADGTEQDRAFANALRLHHVLAGLLERPETTVHYLEVAAAKGREGGADVADPAKDTAAEGNPGYAVKTLPAPQFLRDVRRVVPDEGEESSGASRPFQPRAGLPKVVSGAVDWRRMIDEATGIKVPGNGTRRALPAGNRRAAELDQLYRDPIPGVSLVRWKGVDGEWHNVREGEAYGYTARKPELPMKVSRDKYWQAEIDGWRLPPKGWAPFGGEDKTWRPARSYDEKMPDGFSGKMAAEPFQNMVEPGLLRLLTGHWPEMSYEEILSLNPDGQVLEWARQGEGVSAPHGWDEDAHHDMPYDGALYTVGKRYFQLYNEFRKHPWIVNRFYNHPDIGRWVLEHTRALPDGPFDENHPVLRWVPGIRSIRTFRGFHQPVDGEVQPPHPRWNIADHAPLAARDGIDPPRWARAVYRWSKVQEWANDVIGRYAADNADADVGQIVDAVARPGNPLLRADAGGVSYADGLRLAHHDDGTPLTADQLAQRISRVKSHLMRDEMPVIDHTSPEGRKIARQIDPMAHVADAWNRLTGRGDGQGRTAPTRADLLMLDHFWAEAHFLDTHPGATQHEAEAYANRLGLRWSDNRTPLSEHFVVRGGELIHPGGKHLPLAKDKRLPFSRIPYALDSLPADPGWLTPAARRAVELREPDEIEPPEPGREDPEPWPYYGPRTPHIPHPYYVQWPEFPGAAQLPPVHLTPVRPPPKPHPEPKPQPKPHPGPKPEPKPRRHPEPPPHHHEPEPPEHHRHEPEPPEHHRHRPEPPEHHKHEPEPPAHHRHRPEPPGDHRHRPEPPRHHEHRPEPPGHHGHEPEPPNHHGHEQPPHEQPPHEQPPHGQHGRAHRHEPEPPRHHDHRPRTPGPFAPQPVPPAPWPVPPGPGAGQGWPPPRGDSPGAETPMPGGPPMPGMPAPPPAAAPSGNRSRRRNHMPRVGAGNTGGTEIFVQSHTGWGESAVLDPTTGELRPAQLAMGGLGGLYGDLGGTQVVFYRGGSGLALCIDGRGVDLDAAEVSTCWQRIDQEVTRFAVVVASVVVVDLRYPVTPDDTDLGLFIRDVLADPVRRAEIFSR